MRMAVIFAAILATNEACRVLCIRDGYFSGNAQKLGCLCYDIKPDYEDFVHRRIRIGSTDHEEKEETSIKRTIFEY